MDTQQTQVTTPTWFWALFGAAQGAGQGGGAAAAAKCCRQGPIQPHVLGVAAASWLFAATGREEKRRHNTRHNETK